MTDQEKIIRLQEAITTILKKVEEQAEDEGLWFIAEHIGTAMVQQGLRELHAVIEDATYSIFKKGD